jgi:hypothetical protein
MELALHSRLTLVGALAALGMAIVDASLASAQVTDVLNVVNNNVGIGTSTPTHPLHVLVNGSTDPVLMLEGANASDSLSLKVQHFNAVIGFGLAGGPGSFFATAARDDAVIFSQPGKNLLLGPAGVEAARISATGKVGIGMTAPTHLLDVGVSGAYCNGGAWVDGSSREYKQDIRELSGAEAEEAFAKLSPVRFEYKAAPDEHHVGFIAEDVPELVATKDRKGLSAMDVVAVLTKVVQEQKSSIEAKEVRIATLEQKLDAQRGLLEQLAQKVASLEAEKTEKH